jgi:predicted AlkP superfamily phosphohydrolase/phosphomutase
MYYWANASPVKPWLQQFLATSHISWDDTRVYFRGKGEGNLYVNLVGREARGVVTSGREYEDLRSEVAERLTGIVDERTGEVAITAVHRREELYDGPHRGAAPDLIIEWRDFAYMPTESDVDADSVFTDRWREYMTWPTSGSHRMPGLFLGHGPAIGSGDVGAVALVDIAPTLLALLGIDAPNSFEGQIVVHGR